MDSYEKNRSTIIIRSISDRGIFVIPAEIRKQMDIEPGCKLFVFKSGNGLLLMKIGALYDLMCQRAEVNNRE